MKTGRRTFFRNSLIAGLGLSLPNSNELIASTRQNKGDSIEEDKR